jgi:hypothetical protein
MPKFNFNLRNPGAQRPTPVYLIIRYQKYRLVYPTGEKILPGKWDKNKQRQKFILSPSEIQLKDLSPEQKKEYNSIKNFNSRLVELQKIAERVFDTYLKQNDQEEPEPKEYKLLLDVELEKMQFAKKDLFTYLRNFIDEKKKKAVESRTDQDRGASWRSYEQLNAQLIDYTKYIESEIDFKDIDVDFYYYFADFLRNQKKLLPNTIGKHIKSLKSLLNSATENGLNTNIIYQSKFFKVITEKVDNVSLDELDLELLSKFDLSDNKMLDSVRDTFMISARSGLRYTEFSRIRSISPEKKTIEIADKHNIGSIFLSLHSDLIHLTKKYRGKTPNDLPPVLANVKMNTFIKQICQRIPQLQEPTEIDLVIRRKGNRHTKPNALKYQLISMQTARRSFFINQYMQGVDIYLLMFISGHKSQDNFLKFINVTPDQHAAGLQKKFKTSFLSAASQ